MPRNLPIVYPEEPPEWLPSWPEEKQIKGMFSEGVRSMAFRVLGEETQRVLQWTPDRLVGQMGHQQATWRLLAGGWRRSCSCGYPGGKCPHCFATAAMFRQVCRHEGWSPDGRRQPARPSRPAPRDPAVPRAGTPAAPQGPPSPERIAAEVDFHHEPGKAILRFYLDTGEDRQLLRLQSLHNFARQAAARAPGRTRWQEHDRQFLRWLAPHLGKRPEVLRNLQVLKLTRTQFDLWLERWEDTPGRFVERSSQRQLTLQGTQPSHLVIELKELGPKVRIAAVVVTPTGKRYFFHEVLRMLAQGGEEAVLGGEIVRFTPPFSPELLRDVFADKPRTTNRENICAHLPGLVEGRLDLVEGSCVVKRDLRRGPVVLRAESDGADILLDATVGGVPIRPSSRAAAGGLRQEKGKFVIDVYHVPLADRLRRDLRALGVRERPDERLRVPGDPEIVARFAKLWRQLPEEVERIAATDLADLLEHCHPAEPGLALAEEGRQIRFRVQWECGGVPVTDASVRDAVRLGASVLRTGDGHWLAIDPEATRRALAELEELGFEDGSEQCVFRHLAGQHLASLPKDGIVRVAERSFSLAERIQKGVPTAIGGVPKRLAGILRPYQEEGFRFLAERAAYGVGAVLADDMGLGKTLQALALFQALAAERRTRGGDLRGLVVCPASVIGVWLEEARRFCPGLSCVAYRGSPNPRRQLLAEGAWQVLVVNYAMVRTDAEAFLEQEYDVVLLDEAQQIKNPDARISRIVKQLHTSMALALTGTPLENRLLDLWSVMDFVNPSCLGTREAFVAAEQDPRRRDRLMRRVGPVILRRTKEAVAPELPPRTEELLTIDLTDQQRDLYTRELARARETARRKGPVEILAALTRLRQICCHPGLAAKAPKGGKSAKLEVLKEMLAELAEEGHSALVFSQFTSMLDLIEPELRARGLRTLIITGRTPVDERLARVRRFNDSRESRVFLLSLRAAGTGLNLTKAGYVFLFDPWWNPAVERQAIDRTHRIGQQKPVFAYRLVAADTIEQKMRALQQQKSELFAEVMRGAETGATALPRFTAEDLQMLLD